MSEQGGGGALAELKAFEEEEDNSSIKTDFLKSLNTGDSDEEENESVEAASESEDDKYGSDWEEQGSSFLQWMASEKQKRETD